MAISRDQILSKAFLFPQEQQVAQGRQPLQGGLGGIAPEKQDAYFGIPQAESGFQYTGAMRDKSLSYYKDLAALRQFAREQWTVYGNDVTNPDPRNESGILAAETFKAGIANLQRDADEMKRSREDQVQMLPYQYRNEFVPDQQNYQNTPFAQIAGTPEAGYSQVESPLAKATREATSRTVETAQDYNKLTQQKAQSQALTNQLYPGASAPEQIQRSFAQLGGPTLNIPQTDGGSGAKSAGVHEFLKRVSAVARGASDYKISDQYVDPTTNEALSTTKEFNDGFEGVDRKTGKEVKGVIQEVLRNNNTGALYLKLSTQPDLLPVSMTEFTYGISKANPKYPGVDKISAFVGENKASDETGNIIPEYFLEKKALDKASTQDKTLKEEGGAVTKQLQDVLSVINSVESSGGFSRFFGANDEKELASTLGNMLFAKNGDGTYDLINRKAVIPTGKDYTSEQREKGFTNISEENLAKIVRKYKVRPLTSATETTKPSDPTEPQRNAGETEGAYLLRLSRWRKSK